MSDLPDNPPRSSRFRWRILLLIPLLLCLPLAYFAWAQQGQQRAIVVLKEHGAIVRTETAPIPFFDLLVGNDYAQQIIEVYWVGGDVTADDFAALADASTLRKLELTNSTIDDEGLKYLEGKRDLYALHLSGTNATDAGLAHVAKLKNLEVLSLNESNVTDEGLKNLLELPRLERLFLDSTNITDAGLATVAQISTLKELSLKNLSVTDAGVEQLKTLVNLEILALNNNPNLTREGILVLRKTIPRLVYSLDEENAENPLTK